jgi:hypothetical protein
MFRQSRWLYQGIVFVLIFALLLHVVPLCLQWHLAQLFPADWAGSAGQSSIRCLEGKEVSDLSKNHLVSGYQSYRIDSSTYRQTY